MSTDHDGLTGHHGLSDERPVATHHSSHIRAPLRWARRLGRKARIGIVGGVVLLLTIGLGLGSVAHADTRVTHFSLIGDMQVHLVDHDDLSANEICDQTFNRFTFAQLAPEDPERHVRGRTWGSQVCDDGVQAIVKITASLHEDGSARITGDVQMWSSFCVFNNTANPCSNADFNGTFGIMHLDFDMQPGTVVNLPCRGDHLNIAIFNVLRLEYVAKEAIIAG